MVIRDCSPRGSRAVAGTAPMDMRQPVAPNHAKLAQGTLLGLLRRKHFRVAKAARPVETVLAVVTLVAAAADALVAERLPVAFGNTLGVRGALLRRNK